LNKNVKNKYPKLRTVLSFGGGTDSTNFGSILSTNEKIKIVANSMTKVMFDNGFDGIDIDWECKFLKIILEIIVNFNYYYYYFFFLTIKQFNLWSILCFLPS